MTLYHYKGKCMTCNTGIGWTKATGWIHITQTLCNTLIPKQGSVNK